MAEETTCGTGIAGSAILPTRMAEVMAASADVLTRHTESLDPGEPAGAAERDAWLAIATEHRQLAGRLSAAAAAARMEAQQGLPMANHDMSVLTSEPTISAFAHFVAAQERLSALISEQLVEYRELLDQSTRSATEG